MNPIVNDTVGLIHLITGMVALVTGAWALYVPKRSRTHRRVGYVYAVSMVIMLITSFRIYALFGSFGVFHWLALISTLTLIGGMFPVLLRWPAGSFMVYHFSFMYWSVVGLYMAFFGELAARVPTIMGWRGDVSLLPAGIAGLLFAIGAQLVWNRKKREWAAEFGQSVLS